MLIKAVLVFLGVMVIIAMLGKALFPGAASRMVTRRRKPGLCARCRRPLIGRAGCDCGRNVG